MKRKTPNEPNRPATRALFVHRDLPFHSGVATTFVKYAKFRDPTRVAMQAASMAPASPEVVGRLKQYGVPVHCIGDDGYLKPALTLLRVLREERIDVVLANSLKAYLVAKLASFAVRCRVVFRISAIPLVIQGHLKTLVYRILSRRDALIFASRAVEERHGSSLHRGPAVVIYNGVEDPLASSDGGPYGRERRVEFAIPTDAMVLGYIAEFIGWKDHDTLLDAFAQLASRLPNLHFLLIGAGQRADALQRIVAAMEQGDRVHFLGARSDAVALLGLLDIYVHPAQGEGFGNAVFEAMASGLAVVAARTGMPAEAIRDGETALLFRPGDSADLAEKIERLLDDAGLRQRLGQAARAWTLTTFSPRLFAERLTAVLEDRTD